MNKLNYREIEIINHIAIGFTAKQIAKKIGLEYRTVEAYTSTLRKKLGAKNVAHAVYLACQISVIHVL
jgi:DNA-binding NarL/FixJ family response regulator